MDVWIVVYETNEYYSKEKYRTYENKSDALLQSVEYGSNSEYKFEKVLKLNTTSKKVVEYELVINNGKIDLQEKNS